ncbi:hypothetical protein [Burkholderia ubonensis]|uniref:hypothetical protein n=1 Tax=Burkholderia ubonensis TaxID=101571 RepID=UPI0009B3F1D9
MEGRAGVSEDHRFRDGRWTPAQVDELLSPGKVSGYTGHHINNVESNPAWAGDPRNIVFLSNGPNGGDHLNSLQGHRGNYQNATSGRLIDRSEMINQHQRANENANCR